MNQHMKLGDEGPGAPYGAGTQDGGEFAEEEAKPGFDLREIVLFGIGRSRYIVAGCIGLGLAGGLIAGASQPNTYRSFARLRLQAGLRERLTPEALMGLAEESRFSPAIQEEIFLLEGSEIYRQAAAVIGPREILEPADPRTHDGADTPSPIRWLHELQAKLFALKFDPELCADETSPRCILVAGRALRARTKVEAMRGANVLTVSHTATSPAKAKHAVDELVAAFIDRHRQEFSTSEAAVKNQDELEEALGRYERAQENLKEHTRTCGMIDLDNQKSSALESVTVLEDELADIKSDQRRNELKRQRVEGQLENVPETIEEITPAETRPNPEFLILRERLGGLRLDRLLVDQDGVIRERNELERARQRLDGQIEALQKRLDIMIEQGEIEEVVKPEVTTTMENPDYVRLQLELYELDAEELGLGAQRENKEAALEKKRATLDQAMACEAPHSYLQAEIADTRRMYDELVRRSVRLEALEKLEDEGEVNLSILQAAELPEGKEGPKRFKLLLMGFGAGGALGVGFAVLRQLLDGRIRYPGTIERQLEVPILAVLREDPKLKKLRV